MMEHNVWFQEELPLNHEPSLNRWAHLIAEGEMEDGGTNYDYEYEQAWHSLDAEFNYNYEYREYV
jgi:hypothetical protein